MEVWHSACFSTVQLFCSRNNRFDIVSRIDVSYRYLSVWFLLFPCFYSFYDIYLYISDSQTEVRGPFGDHKGSQEDHEGFLGTARAAIACSTHYFINMYDCWYLFPVKVYLSEHTSVP